MGFYGEVYQKVRGWSLSELENVKGTILTLHERWPDLNDLGRFGGILATETLDECRERGLGGTVRRERHCWDNGDVGALDFEPAKSAIFCGRCRGHSPSIPVMTMLVGHSFA